MVREVNYLNEKVNNSHSDPYAIGPNSVINKKNNPWVKRGLFIFVVIIFLVALYFFIVYSFFISDMEIPEDKNSFLFVVGQVNPIKLIFGEPEEDIYRSAGAGVIGYGITCANTDECLSCLECVDENDFPDLGPLCLYIPLGSSDSNICESPKICDGVGNCIECTSHDDCSVNTDGNLFCNLNENSGTCVESCSPPIDCTGRFCGVDGCGFSCGECLSGEACNLDGICVTQCSPETEDETCKDRDRSCGNFENNCNVEVNCGECLDSQTCNTAGTCVDNPVVVTPPTGGSNPGGGGIVTISGSKIFTPTSTQLKSYSGYQRKDYKEDDEINLKNLDMGDHSLKILELNDDSSIEKDFIKIQVASTPQNATLFPGNIKRFDLNDDSYYDIKVQLNSIKSNKSNISLIQIHEKIEIPTQIINNESDEIGVVNETDDDSSDWDLEEEPKGEVNYMWIIIGIISTLVIAVLMFFLISLFVKIKNVADGKKDITNDPEMKSIVKEHNNNVNKLLLEGYDYLSSNDSKRARIKYEEIKKCYNPMYDPNKRIYDKIGEYLKRIIRLED
ncbi:hypothetical protein GOV12_00395 [Candidatus Pacearchaeota archaeon]|nr:hypothetical protein [Candidatus Pacearchaeota archaeon]